MRFFWCEHQTLNEKKIFYTIGLEHLLATQRAVILHSAYIDYKGKAILFSAPSGTENLHKQNYGG